METAEWIDLVVALGTLLLAVATGALAWFTYQLAKRSRDQLDLLRRHAVAAEQATAIDSRRLDAEVEPRVRIARTSGQGVDVSIDGETLVVVVENCGAVDAEIVEGTVSISNVDLAIRPDPDNPVLGVGETLELRGDLSESDLVQLERFKRLPGVALNLRTRTSAGLLVTVKVELVAKDHGSRWLFNPADAETYEPTQPDYQAAAW